jgi:hypothetical protein
MVQSFEGLRAREDGKFTEGMASSIKGAVNGLVSKLNGFITIGSGELGAWTGNIDAFVNEFTFPAVADTELALLHDLGRTPAFLWVALQDRAGSVYTSSYLSWGPQKIFLKASAANMKVRLVLF